MGTLTTTSEPLSELESDSLESDSESPGSTRRGMGASSRPLVPKLRPVPRVYLLNLPRAICFHVPLQKLELVIDILMNPYKLLSYKPRKFESQNADIACVP